MASQSESKSPYEFIIEESPVLGAKALTVETIPYVLSYWHRAEKSYLEGMGINPEYLDIAKIGHALKDELTTPDREKASCTLVWFYQEEPVGTGTLKRLRYGEYADVHLHLFARHLRARGLGRKLFIHSVAYFLRRFELPAIYCEPLAANPPPNKMMEKFGLAPALTFRGKSSNLCDENELNRYIFTREITAEIIEKLQTRWSSTPLQSASPTDRAPQASQD